MKLTVQWARAACRGLDTDTWFPEGRTADANAARAEAKAICLSCPIREDCLADALAEEAGTGASTRQGIRGGLTAKQRYTLATRRAGAPPPKQCAA
ncbi:WhiB family transcriptional regulator [Streptomyces sp. AM 2-1-1]|uniref:WhiB family transcriptional regulator n=1 Tax=Streptomyces sp. AM 2-1-1 TaxID=3028709 RepID=UPI0023B8CA0A|nr:WhiB family transcriptional regulator [Streptomyces sp. AM 2-1-1]WEH40759.1 WhiB family transcriptional regulator [Streptomyces sp. AM 2-1-1]